MALIGNLLEELDDEKRTIIDILQAENSKTTSNSVFSTNLRGEETPDPSTMGSLESA